MKNVKKKSKHFYHAIVSLESLMVELHSHDFTDDEKKELEELAERTLHHSILDLILSELSENDKHLFLNHHARENHEKIWSLLRDKVEKIEDKIKDTADQVSKKLHSDLKKTGSRF